MGAVSFSWIAEWSETEGAAPPRPVPTWFYAVARLLGEVAP